MSVSKARQLTANAATTRAGNDATKARKRTRRRAVDGRTRQAKRWCALHQRYVAIAGQQHDQLARAAATLIVQREVLDLASARGELVDPLLACRLSGEIRRVLARIEALAEADAPDMTDAAIEAARAHIRGDQKAPAP